MFAKFIGFLVFLVLLGMGLWGILYLATIAIMWVGSWLGMKSKEKKGEASAEFKGRKTLPEQEGITVLYTNK